MLLSISASLCVVSCGIDKDAVSDANFERVAQLNFDNEKSKSDSHGAYKISFRNLSDSKLFADHEQPRGFPINVTTDEQVLDEVRRSDQSSTPRMVSALDEMVRLGYVTKTTHETMVKNEGSDEERTQTVTTYDLTQSGRQLFGPQPNLDVSVGEWTFDKYLGRTMVKDEKTVTGLSYRRSRVMYSYKLTHVSDWFNDSKTLQSIFELPQGIYKDSFNLYNFNNGTGWSTQDKSRAFIGGQRESLADTPASGPVIDDDNTR